MKLRFIEPDGKKMLQQSVNIYQTYVDIDSNFMPVIRKFKIGVKWKDVPLIKETDNEQV